MNQDQISQLKKLHGAIYIILLTITVLVIGFIIVIRVNSQALYSKDLKISALISEIGEVKSRLEEIKMNETQTAGLFDELKNTKLLISNLNRAVTESAQSKEDNWQTVKSRLSETERKMSSMLAEKEIIISELAQKNRKLKEQINLPPLTDSIDNFLIIGQNAQLADTIILLSANPDNEKAVMVSLPRDLYHRGRKLSELYAKYGIDELSKAVGEVTGIQPDKYIVFNFDAFVDLIDFMDGVTVNIPKAFTDKAYPALNNSYTVVSFDAGLQVMDGARALKYARSRKSTSDFDRSARQQLIIQAVKARALEMDMLGRIDLALNAFAKIKDNIKTNVAFYEALGFVQKYKDFEIKTGNVLSNQNYLYSTINTSGQYILLPSGGSYADVQKWIRELII